MISRNRYELFTTKTSLFIGLFPHFFVLTVESVAYKKRLKCEKKNSKIITLFYATFQCKRYSVFKKI